MSKQMRKYCIVGKIVCNMIKAFGILGFYAVWITIFVFSFIK